MKNVWPSNIFCVWYSLEFLHLWVHTQSTHTRTHTLQYNCLMNRHKFVKRFLFSALVYELHFVRPIYWQFLSESYETLSCFFQLHLLLLLLLPSFCVSSSWAGLVRLAHIGKSCACIFSQWARRKTFVSVVVWLLLFFPLRIFLLQNFKFVISAVSFWANFDLCRAVCRVYYINHSDTKKTEIRCMN